MNNTQVVLLCGRATSGKSMSLRGLNDPNGVMYLNCEAGKRLPFRSGFKEYTITDPYQVPEGIQAAENDPAIHTVIIDSITYLMDMFESLYIYKATDGRSAWNDFAQFFKTLIYDSITKSTKNIVVTAHTVSDYNENELIIETKVPIKGALKNTGVESYFTTVIGCKKVTISELEPYESSLLDITEKEKMLGFKYVYQTQLTRETIHDRIRAPDELFSDKETYIDNNIQYVLDRLNEYYTG